MGNAIHKSQRWTPEQLAELEALAANKGDLQWRDIADRIGRTEESCLFAISKIRKQRRREAGLPDVVVVRRPWTEREISELLRLREDEGLRWFEIDRHLNRPESSARQKYEGLRRKKVQAASGAAPNRPVAHDTITASVCGDPPPGRSALDKRNLGIPDAYPPTDYAKAYERRIPRITLATEPMR